MLLLYGIGCSYRGWGVRIQAGELVYIGCDFGIENVVLVYRMGC